MMDDVFEMFTDSCESSLRALASDLSKLRTGRANLGMLNDIRVEYYGQMSPLNQVATLKVADARLITIQPWERSLLSVIERAIGASDLGFNPSNDGTIVRVPVPALTGERRQELVKLARRGGEDHKVSIRNSRRDANDMLKSLQKDNDITEDDMHRGFTKIDQITAQFTAKIDELVTRKEAEILEV